MSQPSGSHIHPCEFEVGLSLMECRFLGFRFGGDAEFRATERLGSGQVLGFKHLISGLVVKASSYSNLSSKAIGRVGLDRIRPETASLYGINEQNGPNSSLFRSFIRILEAADDEYDGVVIDSERLPQNPSTFVSSLRASLSLWRSKGKKGVWLKLPRHRSDLVPMAVQEGFEYHHAEKGYVMLTYWLPEGSSMLPANASHQVGVGGFVINENNEVLVVQEKYCDPDLRHCWKLPTGFINESEEIYSGAVREVQEETGVDTEFVEVIAFRHAHNVAFEKSDLFFICMLRPLSAGIKMDDREIQAAKWMPLAEFVQQPIIKSDNMFNKLIRICLARLNKHYCGLVAHTVVSKFDSKSSSLYYNTTEDDQDNLNCIAE